MSVTRMPLSFEDEVFLEKSFQRTLLVSLTSGVWPRVVVEPSLRV
jgi:hypothetical protein